MRCLVIIHVLTSTPGDVRGVSARCHRLTVMGTGVWRAGMALGAVAWGGSSAVPAPAAPTAAAAGVLPTLEAAPGRFSRGGSPGAVRGSRPAGGMAAQAFPSSCQVAN